MISVTKYSHGHALPFASFIYASATSMYTGWSKKTDTQFYFRDNFGNSAPILTILSLLQAEIYGA